MSRSLRNVVKNNYRQVMQRWHVAFIFVVLAPAVAFATPRASVSDKSVIEELALESPELRAVQAAAAKDDLAGAQKAYLAYRRAKAGITLEPHDNGSQMIDSDGELACEHVIHNRENSLFPTKVPMGQDFDWTHNPIPKDDPAFTEEWTYCIVSRMEFWKGVANAYERTKNEKYAREWVSELMDFAAKNRFSEDGKNGRVSLWRTLDASKRMSLSWPYAYQRFLPSPSFTPEAHWLYLKLVYDHATCLVAGLKVAKRTGNWVTSECHALYMIGALFPEFRSAPQWRDLAVARTIQEMDRIILPDGIEAELSPNYHVIVQKSFLGIWNIANEYHYPLPEAFKAKIMAMYHAMVLMMDQSGVVVPTNDSPEEINAIKLAKQGLAFMPDPILEWAASSGKSGTGYPNSTCLPYAGFYALRSGWKLDDLFLFFRAGPIGLAHVHEDMLQVVLRAGGRILLREPGIYNYDYSDWRYYSLGTSSHNTIVVDGKWQHRGSQGLAPYEYKLTGNPWVTTPVFDYVAGTYDRGYQECIYDPKGERWNPIKWKGPRDYSVAHTRNVLYLRPNYVLIVDALTGSGKHTFDAHFHLEAPAAGIDITTQTAFSRNEQGVQLGLYPLSRENLTVEIVQGQKSPMLGWVPAEHRPIPTVRFRKVQESPATFATLLYPFEGQLPAVTAEAMSCEAPGVWSKRITTPEEKVEILLSTASSPQSLACESTMRGPIAAHATGVMVRKQTNGRETFGGWYLSSYRDSDVEFTLNSPIAVLIEKRSGHLVVFNGASETATITFTRPFAQRAILGSGVWTEITQKGQPQTAQK